MLGKGLQQKLGGTFCCSCCVPVLWRVFTNGSNVHEQLRCMLNKILEVFWDAAKAASLKTKLT